MWHLYVVRTADPRRRWPTLSRRAGSATGRHYPEPIHLSRAYASLGYARGDFPVTEALARRVLSLPIFPGMTDGELDRGRRAPSAVLPRWLTRPANDAPYRLIDDVEFGENVVVCSFTNLYGCRIGDNTRSGRSSRSSAAPSIGARCKIQSHTFICDGVDDRGRGVRRSRRHVRQRQAPARDDCRRDAARRTATGSSLPTRIGRGASLGSGAVVLGGVGSARARSSAPGRS